jgi:F0F1-type ATP synthase delta subunit
MTNYVSRTGGQKKKNILRQKELELRAEIRREAATDKIRRRAENVRAAQLGVIKALLKEAEPPTSESAALRKERLQKLYAEREYWVNISVDEIIRINKEKLDEVPDVDSKKW